MKSIKSIKRVINLINKKYKFQLENLMRFARFIDKETPRVWRFLLGLDVVGLYHPEVTSKITQKFIVCNKENGLILKKEEEMLFLTASLVHDWGELMIQGKGVGDISYDQKTKLHEKKELAVFNLIIKDITDALEKDLIQKAYLEIVIDKDSSLGKMFNAVERIGYLNAAIRAYKGVRGKRITNWNGFVGNVLSNQIEKLIECSNYYPYVNYILTKNSKIITRMFKDVVKNKVPLDCDLNPSYNLKKLKSAQDAWSMDFV